MAASQKHKIDNQPSATLTFLDLPISHIDTSILEKIPFSHHPAVVYPWECWNEFLVVGYVPDRTSWD